MGQQTEKFFRDYYRGTFIANKYEGIGMEERVGEEVWAGEYRDGKRHGKLTCFSLT